MIKIHPKDNVAVALHDIQKGESVTADNIRITAAEPVARGHKIALEDIKEGTPVIKYGCRIGIAGSDIKTGEHVHIHNLKTALSESESYTYEPEIKDESVFPAGTFMGYRRKDGSVGIRNELWIIPTVGCVNSVAEQLVRENTDLAGGAVEGIHCFRHPYGCSQTGEDHDTTKRILADLVRHPNAGGVLVLALGCENLTLDQFKEELGEWDPERVKFLVCQNSEDELREGRKLLEELKEYASTFSREVISASELIVGLKCGGSDGLSGITANPAVGRFSDLLIGMGGSTVLTEVPEMFGAESILFNRCKNREIFDKAVGMVNSFKKYFTDHGQVVYENPSPGNKAGGITTLEDKSCGCVQKGGSAQISDVLRYGERVKERGLTLLSGPGNDMVSTTVLTAAGAHMILFTTGRGTPFGAPVPTLKISTNTELYLKKSNWIDFNAGEIAGGNETIEAAADRLLSLVLTTASGTLTRQEINEFRDIAIFKDGITL
ncbi:MAG: altronate dehydratase family protein [Lachnospiraceae bacterium]|nr:altronate dehydratase family protein [Lachnospiraceae bacterium]